MTAKKLDSILNEMLREITIIKTNWTMWKGLKNELHKGAEYESARVLEIAQKRQ